MNVQAACFLLAWTVALVPVLSIAGTCGDGQLDAGEACDGGGATASCDDDCTLASCGDGRVNELAGESCEPELVAPDLCNDRCLQPTCGDADGDLDVGITDALDALNTSVGLSFCAAYRCDVDESALVTVADAAAILRRGVGLPVPLRCPPDRTVLATGADELIDVLASDSHIWVVDRKRVRKYDFGAALVGEWTAARDLLSATLDGGLLVVADDDGFTTLAASTMHEIISVDTPGSCASIVMVSGPRLICGPDTDVERVFLTYHPTTGELLAESTPQTYHGIPMRKIPGFDGFVSVSSGSPRDFHVHRVDAQSDAATYVQDSPYHGDVDAWTVLTFDSDQADNLITHEGILLRIDPQVCESANAQCLVRNGSLGTLVDNQQYLALTHAGVLAIGLTGGTGFHAGGCDQGCRLVTSHVPTRDVWSDRVLYLEFRRTVAMAATGFGSGVVLGTVDRTDDYPYEDGHYTVHLLPL